MWRGRRSTKLSTSDSQGRHSYSSSERGWDHGRDSTFEEKGSDVNLAVWAMADAYEGRAPCSVIVSGDSDFVELAHLLRARGSHVAVIIPESGQRVNTIPRDFTKHSAAPISPAVNFRIRWSLSPANRSTDRRRGPEKRNARTRQASAPDSRSRTEGCSKRTRRVKSEQGPSWNSGVAFPCVTVAPRSSPVRGG